MEVVGIDLGVHKIALANVGDNPHVAIHMVSTYKPRDLQLRELAAFAEDFCVMSKASQVWIEKPIIGNNRKYSMQISEVCGAVLGELGFCRIQDGTDIRLVDNKSWKKELLGSGNANKDDVRNYIDVTHGLYAPLCDGDQDRYDACCVGLYGLAVLTRSKDLQLDPG